jgi:hypothetical protein
LYFNLSDGIKELTQSGYLLDYGINLGYPMTMKEYPMTFDECRRTIEMSGWIGHFYCSYLYWSNRVFTSFTSNGLSFQIISMELSSFVRTTTVSPGLGFTLAAGKI